MKELEQVINFAPTVVGVVMIILSSMAFKLSHDNKCESKSEAQDYVNLFLIAMSIIITFYLYKN
uniref:Uncharacterized protein n=1 Tax=viral metagenome TaxID=1070528 RepID=A0A6C0J8G8_9ZZZZ